MPNELEACAITGAGSVEEAVARLAAQVRCAVVVTRGAEGAVYAANGAGGAPNGAGGAPLVAVAPTVAVVDTCGAGDAFKAGFLARHVAGAPPASCLAYGTLTGAMSVGRRGGASDPPTPAQVLAFAAATGCYVAARTASGLRGPQIASAAVCSVLNARLSATRSARAHRFYRLPGLCAKLPGLL